MADTFQPRLVNNPFEDPALYVAFRYARRALLFDLGTIDSLSLREIHKLTDVFVSHTHIDHFIGFDHLLRSSLGREDEIRLYGPRGITDNIRGKLAGYAWNLIQNYPLKIVVHEVDGPQRTISCFRAAALFRSEDENHLPFNGILLDRPSFTVRAVILDHRIPCMAFSLEEKSRLNIRQERMEEMGLESGPWLDGLKKMLQGHAPETAQLEMPLKDRREKRKLTLKEWREHLVVETVGQKIVYVVDNIFSPSNVERILCLAQGADLFYCEAAFSQEDESRA